MVSSVGTFRGKMSGIRYIHLIIGHGDIRTVRGRSGLMRIAIEKGDRSKSKLPMPTDQTQWVRDNMILQNPTTAVEKFRNALAMDV